MITRASVIASAKKTLKSESEAILKLVDHIDDSFSDIIHNILDCRGRIVVSGIGKSAIIAQKIVATFNSTGTPSLFMHASEAIHGDLGMVQKGDIIIVISKSGNSPEIKSLVPLLNRMGNILIGMTGNTTSYLAKKSLYVIDTSVDSEADLNNLAPTNSTTAQLAMGDAIAVCLMEAKNFGVQDFAKFHPGGSLGKKLLMKVVEMLDETHRPIVNENASIKDVIVEISEKRLGVTAVVKNEKVIGIITDGDLRRMLNKTLDFRNLVAKDIMTSNPKTVKLSDLVSHALNVLEDNSITQLVVVENEKYCGIIHLHDILKEGIL